MTRLEVMKENKRRYAEQLQKIESMSGLEKRVAETLMLVWIKGTNWMGGISDSRYSAISKKLVLEGFNESDIMVEFERQIERA